MDDNQIRSQVEAAAWILDAAKTDGIPTPTGIGIGYGEISFHVADRADLDRWATWRGLTVTPGPAWPDDPGTRNVYARGEVYDVKVQVYTSEPAEQPESCVCGHTVPQHSEIGCLASASGGRPCNCVRTPGSFRPAVVTS